MSGLKISSEVPFHNQLYEIIKEELSCERTKFNDPVFPVSSLLIGDLNVPLDLEWKRPNELCQYPKLFYSYDKVKIIRPGILTSYATLAGCVMLLGHKEIRSLVLPNILDQDYSANNDIHHTGIFHFRFWRFNSWIDVVVDDQLPVSDGMLLGMQGEVEHEFWCALLEKAYAKFYGSYDALHKLRVNDVMEDFTGGISNVMDISKELNEVQQNTFYEFLAKEKENRSLLCISKIIRGDTTDTNVNETEIIEKLKKRSSLGIKGNHMYALTDLKIVNLISSGIQNLFKDKLRVTVVKLHDPVRNRNAVSSDNLNRNGQSSSVDEGNGAYVFSSSSLVRMNSKNVNWSKLTEQQCETLGLHTNNETEFWMAIEDVMSEFTQIFTIRTYGLFKNAPERWIGRCVLGEWNSSRIGCIADRVLHYDLFRNPQYLLKTDIDQNIVVQLIQSPDVRRQFEHIGFTIIKVEENRKSRLHEILPHFNAISEKPLEIRRSVSHTGFFQKGSYVLIPTSLQAVDDILFMIRLFTSQKVYWKELYRDYPRNVFRDLACIPRIPELGTIVTIAGLNSINFPIADKKVYCILRCEGKEEKTRTSPGENARWNETFIFFRMRTNKPILIKIYSRNRILRDKLLGQFYLPTAVETTWVNSSIVPEHERIEDIYDCTLSVRVLNDPDILAI